MRVAGRVVVGYIWTATSTSAAQRRGRIHVGGEDSFVADRSRVLQACPQTSFARHEDGRRFNTPAIAWYLGVAGLTCVVSLHDPFDSFGAPT